MTTIFISEHIQYPNLEISIRFPDDLIDQIEQSREIIPVTYRKEIIIPATYHQEMIIPPNEQKLDLCIFAQSYNILRIMSGMASLCYSS